MTGCFWLISVGWYSLIRGFVYSYIRLELSRNVVDQPNLRLTEYAQRTTEYVPWCVVVQPHHLLSEKVPSL